MRYNRLLGPILFGAIAVTGAFEGIRHRPYQDAGGVWTICHGQTHGITQSQSYTDEQCALMLASSLNDHNDPLESLHYPLPPNVHIAVLDFSYNLGTNALRRSTLYRKLQTHDIGGACKEFNRWVYVAGKDCRKHSSNCSGIVTRRNVETQLCTGQLSVKAALAQLGHLKSDSEIIHAITH